MILCGIEGFLTLSLSGYINIGLIVLFVKLIKVSWAIENLQVLSIIQICTDVRICQFVTNRAWKNHPKVTN